MFFRSERLFLRPVWPEDWTALASATADDRMVRHLAATAPAAGRFHPQLLVTLPRTAGSGGSLPVGAILLRAHGPAPELDCWIADLHRGQGFGAEAGRAMLVLARTLGHGRLGAAPLAGDRASAGLLRRLGFRPTGVVEPRFSAEHGVTAPVALHVAEIGEVCGGDDDDGGRNGDDGAPMPQRAA